MSPQHQSFHAMLVGYPIHPRCESVITGQHTWILTCNQYAAWLLGMAGIMRCHSVWGRHRILTQTLLQVRECWFHA